ncbi:MAG: HU family DNA-binding protein [Myxococcales bacterium]|nr:HU family DNA-binding protein [Myxococcales bacterium]MCB9712640.1 HU family DNA-binding protein [Myxococcales bacterium]
MTKAELIDRIARSRDLPPDISKKLIGQILGLAFDELASYFARVRVTRSSSPRFAFPHFGTFTKKRRSARRGVNPRTLEPIQIEACDTIHFQVSRELREAMNPGRSTEGEVAEPAPPKAAKKKVAKKKVKAKKASAGAASRGVATGPGRRRLTPRDDEAELGAPLEHALFDPDPGVELPASPMQRVKGRRRSRSRGTG